MDRDTLILSQAKTAHELSAIKRLWDCDYQHDRRKHRHRCQSCHKIINAGEAVTMYRIGNKTRAVHHDCGGIQAVPDSNWTYRDLALAHAYASAIN